MNAFAAMLLYGSKGSDPTDLFLEICSMVGMGDRNTTRDATGANFPARPTHETTAGEDNKEVEAERVILHNMDSVIFL